ncbi:MAG TPA: hypothetical protein VJA46_00130 [Acidimicrobiia bacterium]|nr:hypothetical protein [Acidimicrobiia bacterium]
MRHPETTSDGFLWQAFLIFAASVFAPFQAFTSNTEAPSLSTAVAVTLLVTAVGLLVRWALVRAGLAGLGATYAVSLFLVFFMNTGAFVEDFSGGRWALLSMTLLVAAIGYRLRGLRVFQVLLTWGAFFLIAMPLLTLFDNASPGPVTIDAGIEMTTSDPVAKPDVVVIVADGYPADRVLSGLYAIDNQGFYEELENLGFEVGRDVVSNYPFTVLSVSTMLQLDYVAGEQALTRSDFDAMYDMLGGANRLAGWLKTHGYSQTLVESGWLGTTCGEQVDTCVSGPWPDESLYDIAARSQLRGLSGLEEGRSFSRGTVRTMTWLETELEGLLLNDLPDYVYVHLLAPHPPLFLNSACENQPSSETSGFTMAAPWSTAAEIEVRRAAFSEQLACVNRALLNAARRAVEGGAFMVIFGDHGTDLGGQLYVDGTEWDDAQIWERYRPTVAGYGEGCDFDDLGSLVNLGRRLVGCLTHDDIPDLGSHSYLASKSWDLTEANVPETPDG